MKQMRDGSWAVSERGRFIWFSDKQVRYLRMSGRKLNSLSR